MPLWDVPSWTSSMPTDTARYTVARRTPGERPEHFGFDVNIAGHAAGGPATYLSEQNYGHDKDGQPTSPMHTPDLEKYWGTGTFLTEALTREALSALDDAKRSGQPFYLYMSHYAVHVPIDKDPRYFQKYVEKGLSPKEAAYASLIEGMDAGQHHRDFHERQRWICHQQLLARRTALHTKRSLAVRERVVV